MTGVERIVHGAADTLAPELRAAMARMFARTFQGGGTPGREWASPTYHFLLLRDDDVIGHIGVYRRAIAVGGRMWAVAGIALVGIVPALRGEGRGSRLLAFTQETLRSEGRDDLGLLVTSDNRLGYYGRLGWEQIPGPVSYRDRGATQVETTPVLLLPLRASRDELSAWFTGPVDVAGPFW
jgi:GNAT superfamily N-acetyltransferase